MQSTLIYLKAACWGFAHGHQDTVPEIANGPTQVTSQPLSVYDLSIINTWLLMQNRARLIAKRQRYDSSTTSEPASSISFRPQDHRPSQFSPPIRSQLSKLADDLPIVWDTITIHRYRIGFVSWVEREN